MQKKKETKNIPKIVAQYLVANSIEVPTLIADTKYSLAAQAYLAEK